MSACYAVSIDWFEKQEYTQCADRDEIGYRQANPTGKEIAFNEGLRDMNSSPHWTCTVELSEALTHELAIPSFPAPGFGFDTTGNCPAFAKKKEAKQCMLSLLVY